MLSYCVNHTADNFTAPKVFVVLGAVVQISFTSSYFKESTY